MFKRCPEPANRKGLDMSQEVLTPITQALKEGALSRRELKDLMKRSNRPALVRLGVWAIALVFTGWLIHLSMGSVWFIPAMFLHGVLLVHHFSLQHECCHYTAFKTRKLNDILGNYCGFVILLPNQFFRYEHCDHHTYTQLQGEDPELIELPKSIWGYFWYISSVPYWKNKVAEFVRHLAGRLTEEERRFLPKEIRSTIFLEARIMGACYLAILLACIAFDWWAPLWYWWVPVLLGEPVMRAIRMTEHVGRPTVREMKENTRTNLVSWPMRFLCWNMNYHAEHHYAASVPFHALPRLHKILAGYVYVERGGYLGAHLDIVRQLIGSKPRIDANIDAGGAKSGA